MTEADIYKFADDRLHQIYEVFKADPGIEIGRVTQEVGYSAATVTRIINMHGLKTTHIRKLAATGSVDTGGYRPKVKARIDTRNPYTVPEWMTKPIRAYRHLQTTYQNGVTPC